MPKQTVGVRRREENRGHYFSMFRVTPSFGFFETLSRIGFLLDQLDERKFDGVFSELFDSDRHCCCHWRPMQQRFTASLSMAINKRTKALRRPTGLSSLSPMQESDCSSDKPIGRRWRLIPEGSSRTVRPMPFVSREFASHLEEVYTRR